MHAGSETLHPRRTDHGHAAGPPLERASLRALRRDHGPGARGLAGDPHDDHIAAREAAKLGKVWLPRVIMANHEVTMRAVVAGLAIALAPRDIATEFALAHPIAIAIVPLEDAWAKRQFIICHHPLELLNPATRALLTFLQTCARQREALSA